jgi:type IV secretory pathway VirJ component
MAIVSNHSFKNLALQLALAAATVLGIHSARAADATAAAEPAAPSSIKPALAKVQNASAAKSAKPASAQKAKPKAPSHDPKAVRILQYPGIGEVTVYAPQGEARGLALFLSGDGGWNLGVWDMAQTAAELGYWVAGFSTPAYLQTLETSSGTCSDAAGLLEHIGDAVKREMKISSAFRPVLIGYSSGATIGYAALAESGDARFGGAMTLGFCPDLIIHRPWCEGAGGLTATKMSHSPYWPIFNTVPRVPAPWIVLQGEIDQVCNPPATVAFVDKVKNGKVVSLPKVGHGFGVPRNWMPQYRQGLIDLRDASAPSHVTASGG